MRPTRLSKPYAAGVLRRGTRPAHRLRTSALAFLALVLGFSAFASPAGADSANSRWLADAYEQIFGRPADDAGLTFWLGRMAAGGDEARSEVAASMLFSPEGSGNEVVRAYQDLLGRGTDPGGHAFWTDYLGTRPVTGLRSAILSSDELFLASGGNQGWIDQMYAELLNREPDPAGRAFWLHHLENGVNRYWLVNAMYQSDESLSGRVQAYYQETLGRPANDTEVIAGVAMIRAKNERVFRAFVLSLDEAFEPFVSAPGSS